MASTTMKRALKLPLKLVDGDLIVEDFGYFIDTHRDMPHIGMFEDDLHRGLCKPTKVHYVPASASSGHPGWLQRASDGKRLELHPKHQFVTEEWFRKFLIDRVMTAGTTPLDKNGEMPTSLLRDPRRKLYELRSFRQMVTHHLLKGSK